MKIPLAALFLIFTVNAGAQYIVPDAPMIDFSCFATLKQADGKVKKNLIDRQAYTRVSKDINVAFQSPFYGGDPVEAAITIVDTHTKEAEVFTSTINSNHWKFSVERETKYGHLKIDCQ